ncbi:YraN family protein [Fretibacter rubidus]|uniref:YraN family protein n=1 Tax=Fretibacter rubidus TaxID=570162 RepID=UPI00352A3888
MRKTRQDYEKAGRLAEKFAVNYLRLKGYKILEQRYKTREGEIDIIARHKDCLVIVEVKQRQSRLDAHESITRAAEHRIDGAADIYISDNAFAQGLGVRFDAVFLIGASPLRWKVEHIIDAWRLE